MNKLFTSLKWLAAIIVLATAMASCSKAPEHVNYIPKDANVVLTIDVKSIGVKSMDFKEIFSLENIKKAVSGNSSKDSTMEKLKNSGIDLLNTAYVFGNVSGENSGYGALILSLSDKDKFEKFVKDFDKNLKISQEGDYKVASSPSDEQTVIAWSKNTGLFVFQSQGEQIKTKDKAIAILNQKKEESLAENDKNFKELLKQSSDISFWINFEKLGKLAQAYSQTVSPIDFKETYLTAACNFEKGQVVVNTEYHANKQISEKLNFAKESLSKEIVGVVPGKSIVGLLGAALDMSKLYTYLDKEKLLAGVESAASGTTGFGAKDLFQIFNGELVMTLNGVAMQDVQRYNPETGEAEMRKEPKPEFSLVVGINDKAKSAKLLSTLSEKGLIQKNDNYYSVAGEYFIVDKGSYLILVPETLKQTAIEGKGEHLNAELTGLLTQNSGAFYFGLKNVPDDALTAFGPSIKDWVKSTPLDAITFTSSSLKDQVSTGKCVITFKEKEQNSLITLAKMSNDLAARTSQAFRSNVAGADSVSIEEPVEVEPVP